MAEKTWEMRRKDRAIDEEEALVIVEKGEYGVLATVGGEAEPYAVPLSYILMDGALYFHCAKKGRKIENINREPRGCFVVVGKTKPVYLKNFTTLFESAVVEGKISKVTEEEEKKKALFGLCEKYLPEHRDKAPADIEASFGRTEVLRMEMERLSGKAKRG